MNGRRSGCGSVWGVVMAIGLCRAVLGAPPTPEDLVTMARVSGLEFTETQAGMMTAEVGRMLGKLESLRASDLPNELPPALRFDPRPAGFVMPSAREPLRWDPPAASGGAADPDTLAWLGVSELSALLRSRQVTSEELTRLALARLETHGPRLRCVVTLLRDRALASARRADAELAAGRWRGPLHGVPYGAKDLLDAAGAETSWGVSLLTNRIPAADAEVIRRLDAAGAVLVAKLSLGELAMGDVWYGGRTRNPWNPERGSSGSSAGSAAAVAAGLVPFALGSETLGSIVSPSTVCGVTGLRPTFGRVPRTGAMTLCWSLDKLGPIARSAADCALVLDVIRGPDGRDLSVVDAPFDDPFRRDIRSLRVGFLEEDLRADADHWDDHERTLGALRALGMVPKPVTLPDIPGGALTLVLMAEAAAAFDAWTRSGDVDRLVQQEPGSWPNQFRAARFIPAVEYLQANRLRTRLMEAMDRLFDEVDVLVVPPWAGRSLLYSNFSGHPCVVLPNGDRSGGRSSGICLLGPLYGETSILAVAHALQQKTDWHRRRPSL